MGKKKKKIDKVEWKRGLMNFAGDGGGSKEAKELLERYNVEGYRNSRSDRHSYGYRGTEQVQADLERAMMNDYDTRRSIEAAAMAGNKDAKKFAKKGIEGAKGLLGAHALMKDLKKEYVGGGGMNGAENRAGLTHALVKADRENFESGLDERYDSKYASQKALEEMQEKLKRDALRPDAAPELSQAMQEANDGIESYDDNMSSFGDMLVGKSDDLGQAEAEASMETAGSSDAAQDFKDKYSANVKGGLKLSGIETRGPQSGIRPGEGF